MNIEAKRRFLPRLLLVPLAVGTIAWEVANTPRAEAGGYFDGRVIASPQIPSEDIESLPNILLAIGSGAIAGLGYYYWSRRR